jgi:hypothetical protein
MHPFPVPRAAMHCLLILDKERHKKLAWIKTQQPLKNLSHRQARAARWHLVDFARSCSSCISSA